MFCMRATEVSLRVMGLGLIWGVDGGEWMWFIRKYFGKVACSTPQKHLLRFSL